MLKSMHYKTSQIYIRITPDLKAQLQQAAAGQGRSVSNYLEFIIRKALEK